MLSYEEIFRRHSRPLTYLNGHLDSPVTRIPTPMNRRSPVAYKERRRPTSLACLDSLYSYREKDMIPRVFSDDQKLGSRDITSMILSEGFNQPLRENTQRITRYTNNYNSTEDVQSKIPSNSPRYASNDRTCKISSDSPKYASNDRTSKISGDSPRFAANDRTYKILGDTDKYSAKENAPRIVSDIYKTPVKDRKSRNVSDNYRHAVSFPDSHLSRRELPLCTPDELLDIIREPAGYYALPTDPWNEVYPDIYLSDAPTALCTAVLKRLGITHVLNAAQGKEKGCGQVNTTSGFYLNSGITFLGVPAFDNIVFRIYPYFEQAAQFIDDGLKAKGKVLVHCRAGISRSATLVCAFLMIKRGMTVQEAVRSVRKNRAIIPNDGFLQQLCDLNDRLKRKNKSCAY